MMGEHTDYNDGLVCPMALDMACYAAMAPSQDGSLAVYSANFKECRVWEVDSLPSLRPASDWGDYVAGVAVELERAGFAIPSCRIYIQSDVPGGAGLSSSASLEVATALSLLADREMDRLEIARLCRRAESSFVGMPCGIMDQYASLFGQADSAIQIDCRSLESETVHLPSNLRVVVVNSRVKHELGNSAYRQRVQECQEAIHAIRKFIPSVRSLRDVVWADFKNIESSLPETPRKRARHVITDNNRVLQFAEAARRSDLAEMGRLFVASHHSARNDYEISCEELDFLVGSACAMDGVYGARMTGGGFGGCTVNLLAPEATEKFRQELTTRYQNQFGITPLFYDCVPAAGASCLSNKKAA
jgi:galactokinase